MNRIYSAVLTAAFLAAGVTTSHAGAVLVSPILPSGISGAVNEVCQALNAGTKTLEVTVDIVDSADNTIIATSGLQSVNPGLHVTVSAGSPSVNTFCRATGLSTKSGRLSYVAVSGGSNVLMNVSNP
jgi:hypothetical protein